MAGIDAQTGKRIDGFAHVEQSLGKIITTMIGERVMHEWVGNPGTKLLGENAVERTVLAWVTIIYALTELFEPRFKIRRFALNDIDRPGAADFSIVGDYRPYAHLDWQQAEVFVSVVDGIVSVVPGR